MIPPSTGTKARMFSTPGALAKPMVRSISPGVAVPENILVPRKYVR
jgi:hypothetical protein